MRVIALVLAGSVLAGTAAPAMAALELEPTSEWRLREYDDKCRISRTFGEGEDAVTLWIEKGGPGRYYNITAIGRPFRSPYGARVDIGFAPGEMQTRGFVSNTSSSGRPVISLFGVQLVPFDKDPSANRTSPAEPSESLDLSKLPDRETAAPEVLAERFDAVRSLDLSGALVEKVSLKTGSALPVATQLADCTSAMLEKRTKASESSAARGQGPRADGEREWATRIHAEYPAYLLRESAQGSVGVRVAVSPEGRATFCEVLEFVGPAGFNDAACLSMVRHARFSPARDRAGQPVWGTFVTRITYRINP